MPIRLSYENADYVFARIHGLWADGVNGPRIAQMTACPTPEALQHALRPFGVDAGTRERLFQSLTERECRRLESISLSLGEENARYYDAFLGRFYFRNLASLLKLRFLAADEFDCDGVLFVCCKGLPEFNRDALLAPRAAADFAAGIPLYGDFTREDLSGLLALVAKQPTALTIDAAVDRLSYRMLLDAATHAGHGVRRAARELVAGEIDVENLSILMRNVCSYHLPQETLAELLLADGLYLTPKHREQMLASGDFASLAAVLPEPYHSLAVSAGSPPDLHVFESALWNNLHAACLRRFRDAANPESSVAAFPYLNHFEALNIERICEAVYLGLPSREMRDMLVG